MAHRVLALVLATSLLGTCSLDAQTLRALESGRVPYFIAEPAADGAAHALDADLAEWAVATWQAAVGPALDLVRVSDERSALIRLYWAPAEGGQYGEMRPIEVAGKRGAAVFVRPETQAFGGQVAIRAGLDGLFRDTIVYLTCVHELGHALGLAHTDDFADIMYAFGFGGDIGEYFGRFRAKLHARSDIPKTPLLSAGDRRQLAQLYGARGLIAAAARAN